MRLFIAIELGKEVLEKISHIQQKLSSPDYGLKLVEQENLHLTLKFLGDVPEEQARKIESLIHESLESFRPFTLSLEGLGYFGLHGRISAIWIGVKEGREEFVRLAKELDNRLAFVRKEEHGPSPHLTIARVKSGRNAQQLMREVVSKSGVKVGEARVKEIKLRQSVLTPHGPLYSDMKTFQLKESEIAERRRQDSPSVR